MKVSCHQLAFSALSAATLTCGFALPSQALTLQTFTDFSQFQNATTLATADFNDATLSDAENHTLTDFSISSDMTWSRIAAGDETGNIDGSTFLRLQSRNSDTSATLTFSTAISAFGFDWANTDNSTEILDVLELIIGDQAFEFGLPKQSGFFGVIATDGTFSDVQISDTAGGGYLLYGGIDNVRYGDILMPETSPATVPTPAAVLPNLAVLFLSRCRRRGDRQLNQK